MTAAHQEVAPVPAQAGRGLALVPDDSGEGLKSSETPLAWEAEHAFLGAVLHAGNATATAWLALIDNDDLDDPQARLLIAACRIVAVAGGEPDPVTAVAAAQQDGLAAGETALKRFHAFTFHCYSMVPHPHTGRVYAQLVLAQAWRRRVEIAGQRLIQAASEAADDTLTRLLAHEYAALRAVYARRQAAERNTA